MAEQHSTVTIGTNAESRATTLLVDHGYQIVERNFRCEAGELDIVARERAILVFVEVRSRADDDHGTAAETVAWRKQRQIARVAEHYLAERDPDYEEIRFDVLSITGEDVELIKDAFRLGDLR